MIATGVLAYFTVVLALATNKLHKSTKRYADITDKSYYLSALIFTRQIEKELIGPSGRESVTLG